MCWQTLKRLCFSLTYATAWCHTRNHICFLRGPILIKTFLTQADLPTTFLPLAPSVHRLCRSGAAHLYVITQYELRHTRENRTLGLCWAVWVGTGRESEWFCTTVLKTHGGPLVPPGTCWPLSWRLECHPERNAANAMKIYAVDTKIKILTRHKNGVVIPDAFNDIVQEWERQHQCLEVFNTSTMQSESREESKKVLIFTVNKCLWLLLKKSLSPTTLHKQSQFIVPGNYYDSWPHVGLLHS